MFELIGRAQAAVPKVIPSFPSFRPIQSGGSVTGLFLTIANWIVWIGGVLAIIYLVYGGILYITAGGDAEKATKGRTAVINAVIGLVIILLALVIVQWISTEVQSAI